MNNTFLANTTSAIQGAFMGRRLWAMVGFSLLVFLAACTSAPAPAVGTLQVNITGLPTGASGNVRITGPNSFSQTINASTPLSGLVSGSYTITPSNIPGVGATANFTFGGTVTGNPATVVAGSTVNATVTYAAITGALTVNVAGLPAGTNANLVVTGPGGFTRTLTATTTLPALVPGLYTVTANNVRATGAIVDAVFTSTTDGVNVVAGQTLAGTFTYTQRTGSGTLWIPTNGGFIKGYTEAQLASSGTVEPLGSLTQTGINDQAVFDKDGRLFVSNGSDNAIYSAIGGLPPIRGANTRLNRPRGMAFDRNGNLWVMNGGAIVGANTAQDDSLLAFTPAQLQAGGNQTPSVVLTSSSFVNPVGVAFDDSGSMWVSNFGTFTSSNAGSVIRLNPPELLASGNVTAARTITGLNTPTGLAFDSGGNLWVADQFTQRLLKFIPSQLATGGDLTANATLEGFTNLPRGLVFDNAGNLWVLQEASLQQINAADLTAPGTRTPTPARTITGFGGISLGLAAFGPTPSNLPINNK